MTNTDGRIILDILKFFNEYDTDNSTFDKDLFKNRINGLYDRIKKVQFL